MRNLSLIAADIRKHWPAPNFAAKPYLDAMSTLTDMTSKYGLDDAHSIVLYFLSNAGAWRGPEARRIKQELKAALRE